MSIDALLESVAERAARKVLETAPASAPDLPSLPASLDPWKPYTAKEVASFLSISPGRVYGIDPKLLKPTYTGPSGGSKRYLGINVLMYVLGMPPVDEQAIGEAMRDAFIAQAREPVAVKKHPVLKGRVRVV